MTNIVENEEKNQNSKDYQECIDIINEWIEIVKKHYEIDNKMLEFIKSIKEAESYLKEKKEPLGTKLIDFYITEIQIAENDLRTVKVTETGEIIFPEADNESVFKKDLRNKYATLLVDLLPSLLNYKIQYAQKQELTAEKDELMKKITILNNQENELIQKLYNLLNSSEFIRNYMVQKYEIDENVKKMFNFIISTNPDFEKFFGQTLSKTNTK